MAPDEPAAPPGELVRSLTLIPAASVVLSNVIGTGVFIKARVMTCNVGTPAMVFTVMVLAGLLSMAGALAYAELGAMMPRAGGEYNFLGAAYGRLWAFLYSWTRTIAVAISGGAIAIAFTTFLNDLLDKSLPAGAIKPIAVGSIAVATALNLVSAKSSGWVATGLTAVKVTLLAGIGIAAFVLSDGFWGHFAMSAAGAVCEDVPPGTRLGIGGFGAAMLGALWSYNGWNVISHIGGEVRDPSRNLPRALIGGTGLVMVLYLLVYAAYFYVLTPLEIASVPSTSSVAREAVGRFMGKGAAGMLAAGMMLSAYGTLHTGLLTAPRLPFALARDGLLPRALARVSTRGVPARSVVMVGALTAALTLSGTFDALTDVYVFVQWVFFALTCSALFVLRRTHPDADRPFRVWGYPLVPALFLLVAAYLLANTLIATPNRALSGLVLIALGLPVYLYYSRRPASL